MPELYNGIQISEAWPPRYPQCSMVTPQPVPYLTNRPTIAPINLGRQLFVDDFLIESTTLTRAFHQPSLYQDGPVFFPQTPLEMNGGYAPMACPFNDGIIYDDGDNLFKMWYHAGFFDGTAYAQSKDGLRWTRLSDMDPESFGRAIPFQPGMQRDGASAWIDYGAEDPSERYKMFVYYRELKEPDQIFYAMKKRTQVGERAILYASGDGIHWRAVSHTGKCGDNTDFFYNPFRKKWVFSIRRNTPVDPRVRARYYYECDDFFRQAQWEDDAPVFWDRCSLQDRPDENLGHPPQLYNLDAVGYESLMLGAYHIFLGPPNEICEKIHRPKIMDIKLAFSRDGFHFDRANNEPALRSSRVDGRWDYGYLHTHSGIVHVVGDRLYFFFSAWSGNSPVLGMNMYSGGSVGLATMRRDGFASMDAPAGGGVLTSRTLTSDHPYLFVNADCKAGALTVDVLDTEGNPVAPLQGSLPVAGDSCKARITWPDARDLSALRGKPFRLRFRMTDGSLYAFWLSPSERGESLGYMGAGGPGFTGGRDL